MIMENFWRDAQKLPNIITLVRMIFGAPVTIILYKNGFEYAWLVFLLFAVTDLLDGYIARKTNTATSLGARLDPLADQFLVLPVMWYLACVGVWSYIMPTMFLLREILILLIRAYAEMPYNWLGKIKINAEYAGVALFIFGVQGYYYGFLIIVAALLSAYLSLAYYAVIAFGLQNKDHNA